MHISGIGCWVARHAVGHLYAINAFDPGMLMQWRELLQMLSISLRNFLLSKLTSAGSEIPKSCMELDKMHLIYQHYWLIPEAVFINFLLSNEYHPKYPWKTKFCDKSNRRSLNQHNYYNVKSKQTTAILLLCKLLPKKTEIILIYSNLLIKLKKKKKQRKKVLLHRISSIYGQSTKKSKSKETSVLPGNLKISHFHTHTFCLLSSLIKIYVHFFS